MQLERSMEVCPGCHAHYLPCDGPTHPYIGASAACWATYGEVLAREYREFGYPDVHRLTVDAYAAQHPGIEFRQSIQSVAIHLIGLYLWLECGKSAREITARLRVAVKRGGFTWLTPPKQPGVITVQEVVLATNRDDHISKVEAWARSVWQAWQDHAATVKRWADIS
jgi:hypothetical protein